MPTICVARAKGERIRYHTRLIVCKNVYDPSGQQKRKEKQHTDRRNSGQKVKLKSSAQMMLYKPSGIYNNNS